MANLPASQPPERLPAGSTSDPPYGPWADIGSGNPFFYHVFSDDFDNSLGASGLWVVSENGSGTAAHVAGDGGLVILTTAATSTDYVSIQLPEPDFTLPQGTLAGKKLGFLCRFQISDITNSAFAVGLCDQTATVFTAITDGIWFSKASGSTQIVLNISHSSTNLATNVPTADYSLAAATNIDVAFTIDRFGNVSYSIAPAVSGGPLLVGWVPQSGTSAGTPVRCPVGRLYSGNQPGTVSSGFTLSSANLTPTIGVQAGAAAAKTLTADFIGVAKER